MDTRPFEAARQSRQFLRFLCRTLYRGGAWCCTHYGTPAQRKQCPAYSVPLQVIPMVSFEIWRVVAVCDLPSQINADGLA